LIGIKNIFKYIFYLLLSLLIILLVLLAFSLTGCLDYWTTISTKEFNELQEKSFEKGLLHSNMTSMEYVGSDDKYDYYLLKSLHSETRYKVKRDD